MRYSLIFPDSEPWQRMLEEVNHDIYHLPQYCALEANQTGGVPVAFYAEDQENRRFLLPMITRRIPYSQAAEPLYDAVSPYGYPGPLIHCPEANRDTFTAAALTEMKKVLAEKRIITLFMRFHPVLEVPLQPFRSTGVLVQSGESISIDLTLPEEVAWAQIDPDHRRKIRRVRAAGAEAFIDKDWRHFDEFERLYSETMIRHRANPSYFFPRVYFDQLKAFLGDKLQLCIVCMEDQVAAAGLITESGGIVQGYLNGTNIEFIQKSPALLLYDSIRRWAKERGNRLFHLGSGVGGKRDTLFDFKARFSKVRHSFYTWRLVVNETAYQSVVKEWEISTGQFAGDDTSYFPVYRRPLIPTKPATDRMFPAT